MSNDVLFLKHFSMVIAFLIGVALLLIVLAHSIGSQQHRDQDPNAQARLAERIMPLGAVYAGSSGAAAAAAAAEAARTAAGPKVAYDGTLDGQVIYDKLCAACHSTGAGGSPTLDHSHWDARLAQGTETLIKHAIEGFHGDAGLMPARGGNPDLSDAQVEAAVTWMMGHLK